MFLVSFSLPSYLATKLYITHSSPWSSNLGIHIYTYPFLACRSVCLHGCWRSHSLIASFIITIINLLHLPSLSLLWVSLSLSLYISLFHIFLLSTTLCFLTPRKAPLVDLIKTIWFGDFVCVCGILGDISILELKGYDGSRLICSCEALFGPVFKNFFLTPLWVLKKAWISSKSHEKIFLSFQQNFVL